MFLLFKGTNQKLHMLLLHTYYQPELRHVATTSYQENLKYSFDWEVIYPVKICITVQEEENTFKDSWQPLPHNSKNKHFVESKIYHNFMHHEERKMQPNKL